MQKPTSFLYVYHSKFEYLANVVSQSFNSVASTITCLKVIIHKITLENIETHTFCTNKMWFCNFREQKKNIIKISSLKIHFLQLSCKLLYLFNGKDLRCYFNKRRWRSIYLFCFFIVSKSIFFLYQYIPKYISF